MHETAQSSLSVTSERPSPVFSNELWQAVLRLAETAGLNTSFYGAAQREIVDIVADFLLTQDSENSGIPAPVSERKRGLKRWIGRRRPAQRAGAGDVERTAVPPVVICGRPGTGKTTFLAVLDIVLRQEFGLADAIDHVMVRPDGRERRIHKRLFCGMRLSLLSVKKWTALLHFFTWDTATHRFSQADRERFVRDTLRPMKVLFTDEVEITGYAPTISDMASAGILVLGSSNQTEFPQLTQTVGVPRIYTFTGSDMRAGEPDDAVVEAGDSAVQLFEKCTIQPARRQEQLAYQSLAEANLVVLLLEFDNAVTAPMLEMEWVDFLQATYAEAALDHETYRPLAPYILLLEQFALSKLANDYNATIRFVNLFDVIEQLGMGVLLQHHDQPIQLTTESIRQMKATIRETPGVTEDIKARALVGVDRTLSRLGHAGQRARSWLAPA